jgi:hypothetical protein
MWDLGFSQLRLWRLLSCKTDTCSLVDSHKNFGGIFYPADGGSRFLQNVDIPLINYTVSHPKL